MARKEDMSCSALRDLLPSLESGSSVMGTLAIKVNQAFPLDGVYSSLTLTSISRSEYRLRLRREGSPENLRSYKFETLYSLKGTGVYFLGSSLGLRDIISFTLVGSQQAEAFRKHLG